MDLLKILRSFEEFIFEATTWLVLYPLTLWRIVRDPLGAMAYSDAQQHAPEDSRYNDAISPPLLLLATIVLLNLIGMALHVAQPVGQGELGRRVLSSQQHLVMLRSLLFSLIPLLSAVTLLRRRRIAISRDTLRAPFYAQCYLAAPFTATVSIGGIMLQRPSASNAVAAIAALAGLAWFIVVQTRWFQTKLEVSRLTAFRLAAGSMAMALLFLLVIVLPLVMV